MDAFREELSGFSSKSDELCYAATLVSSPQRDPQRRSETSRLNHFDLLVRHQLGSQVSQSDPDLFATKDQDHKIHQWAEDFSREGLSKGQHEFPLHVSCLQTGLFSPSISRQANPWVTSLCCVVRTTSGVCRRAEPRRPGPQIEGQEESAQGRSAQTGSSQPSRFSRNFS